MATVNVREARTHFSRLLRQVEAGDEIVIARHGTPVARLVPEKKRGKRQFGALRGRLVVPDSFFDPLPDTELTAWGADLVADRESG